MSLKSTSSPLDVLLLSEWRTQVCAYKGVTYANQSAAWQTMFDDTVNRAFEYLSQRANHHPWGQQETTLAVTAGSDTTYSMPAAMRSVVAIYEIGADGNRRNAVADPVGKQSWFNAQQSGTTHPWTNLDVPIWFYDGLTDGQPPVQQWRRVGLDNSGATAYVLFRPYFNLLATSGQDAYPYLPAAESEAILFKIIETIEAFGRNWDAAQFFRGMKEDAIHALEVGDRRTAETPMRLGVDPDFARQMEGS